METRPPMVLRVFQWTLWLLMLGLFAYAFLPSIINRLTTSAKVPTASITVDGIHARNREGSI